jgi:hypothetical protein
MASGACLETDGMVFYNCNGLVLHNYTGLLLKTRRRSDWLPFFALLFSVSRPASYTRTVALPVALDLNRGHDKSLSYNLDQKTGEWKAEYVRYRYKRDTELVVGCAGYASLTLLSLLYRACITLALRLN